MGGPTAGGGHGSGLFGGRRKQLKAENQQLRTKQEELRAEVQRLRANEEKLRAEVQQLRAKQEQLEADNVQLRNKTQQQHQEITRLMGIDPDQIAAQAARLRTELAQTQRQSVTARETLQATEREIAAARAQLVQTQEVALLQEAGLYEYLHPLDDAVAYKARLTELQDKIKSMARGNQAVLSTTNWTVNGSTREGAAMIRDFSKLMLRAYNAEADSCIRTVRPHRVHATIDRLTKVRDIIARLGNRMDIRIASDYHNARVQEIRLTADYVGKVEDEKERVRAERERQREEQRARRDFELEKARLAKEQAHYLSVLARLQTNGATTGLADVQTKLTEIQAAIAGVEAREANIRAGYVYVISNLGAFGPDMVKIGMTRRLDPQDRIRELGDASVPFRFDTHALVFSEDAVGLETRLHTELAARKVNQVNNRREFFYVTPADVRSLLQRVAGQHLLEYHEIPEALEWRASGQHARATPLPAA
jgi:hypothetical protein